MKIVELLNNIRLPITNEEADLLGKFDHSAKITKKELSLREQVVVNSLVNKDIIKRVKHEGQLAYQKAI